MDGLSTTADFEISVSCRNCGYTDNGRFCSNCGARLKRNKQGAVSAVAHDVFQLGERHDYAWTFLRLLPNPTPRTIALLDDPSYRSHGKFLATAVGLYVLSYSFLVPNVMDAKLVEQLFAEMGDYWHKYLSSYGKLRDILMPISTFLRFVLAFLVGFFVLRALSGNRREPGDYLKLVCLSAGFSTTVSLFYLVPLLYHKLVLSHQAAWAFTMARTDMTIALGILFGLFSLFLALTIFRYQVRTQKYFWQMPIWKVILGMFISFIVASILHLSTIAGTVALMAMLG